MTTDFVRRIATPSSRFYALGFASWRVAGGGWTEQGFPGPIFAQAPAAKLVQMVRETRRRSTSTSTTLLPPDTGRVLGGCADRTTERWGCIM